MSLKSHGKVLLLLVNTSATDNIMEIRLLAANHPYLKNENRTNRAQI